MRGFPRVQKKEECGANNTMPRKIIAIALCAMMLASRVSAMGEEACHHIEPD